jgi:uncharacterized protein
MGTAIASRLKCLLVVILGGVAIAPVAAQQTPVSSIRVTGDAKVTAKPDRAQIDVGVVTHAPKSQDAAAQNATLVDAVLAAVRAAAGGSAVLKTIGYSLNPTYQYHPNGGEPTITGYAASNTVQITLDDLAKIGSIIDSATRAGANQVQGIEFTLRNPDSARAEALRRAVLKARTDADVLAAALGLKVVRVLNVEESGPHVAPVRMFARAASPAAAQAPTPVESGTLEVTADVVLTVEVSPTAR